MEVCNANSQQTMHIAWVNVHKLDAEAPKCHAMYRQAWSALQCLSIDLEYVVTLQDIMDDGFKVAEDPTYEQRFGQWLDTLLWFWFGDAVGSSGPCMLHIAIIHVISDSFTFSL
jgi:hypothetical protein